MLGKSRWALKSAAAAVALAWAVMMLAIGAEACVMLTVSAISGTISVYTPLTFAGFTGQRGVKFSRLPLMRIESV